MSSFYLPPPLFLLLILFFLAGGDRIADPTQCASLIELNNALNTSRLPSWLPRTDCCSWVGVACDPGSGSVTSLDLSSRAIRGKIPRSLFNLTSLRALNLAYSLFDEIPVPPAFELLGNLTNLNLSNAGFSGHVPVGIAKLTNLVSLDLSTMEFQNESLQLDTLVATMSNLRELCLGGVNVSADGLHWSSALAKSTPKLEVLNLKGCSLTGPFDDLFAKLRFLSVIQLSQNELKCSVPDFFAEFPSLAEIQLSSCGLNGEFPKNLFLLRNLTIVDLSDNPLLSVSLPEFHDETKLQGLMLSSTKFSGPLPNSTGKLKYLNTMELSKCQLSGVMPSSIANLTQLTHLDISANNISGQIPPSMGRLQRLAKLDLSDNLLSGRIPASLFTLPALQALKLNSNQLSGLLQEFSNGSIGLYTVDLSDNALQGNLPRSVFQLHGLEILNLASNNFTGTVQLDWFTSLRNLTYLDLSYNHLMIQDMVSVRPDFLANISTLLLASCHLTRIPGFLRYQEQVGSLDLSNNMITGAVPSWIWSIGNYRLRYLNLSYNLFNSVEEPLPDFSMNRSLMNLDLHSNMIQGPIPLPPMYTIVLDYSNNLFSSSVPANISSYLNYTVFFSLANNGITGEIPPSICDASYLQVLDLSNNLLGGGIPPCLLEGGSSIAVLNLGGNKLQGSIPGNISVGCGLRTINLNGNRLEGQIPRSLANCNDLEVLDLGYNHISGTFPCWLGDISSLRVLVLRSNGLSGPISPALQKISATIASSMLQIIDISSNNFTGALTASCFENLKAMMLTDRNSSSIQFEYMSLEPAYYENIVTVTSKGMVMTLVRTLAIFSSLDFSDNHFEGSIPDIVGELAALKGLNFSNNALTGKIPSSVGDLVQLESLDLSQNLLSGEIPVTLMNLTFLSYLNLSDNKLVGIIPLGNQLSTFLNTSYLGNEGLCGSPLTKQCGNTNSSSKPDISFEPATQVNWQFVFVGLAFGGGLAMVIGTLMSWETGRRWYNKKVDRMLEAMIPLAFLQLLCEFADRRVGAEEEMVIGSTDCGEMEEWQGRKFCVFCTELEFSQGRVRVHHLECDCPLEEER